MLSVKTSDEVLAEAMFILSKSAETDDYVVSLALIEAGSRIIDLSRSIKEIREYFSGSPVNINDSGLTDMQRLKIIKMIDDKDSRVLFK